MNYEKAWNELKEYVNQLIEFNRKPNWADEPLIQILGGGEAARAYHKQSKQIGAVAFQDVLNQMEEIEERAA